MIKHIKENEKRLDKIVEVINELEENLNIFKNMKADIENLNKYYGSKEWFKDVEEYESGKIKNVKAGVLSEDAVWNANEKIIEIAEEMKSISETILNKNK